jgi:hypothetical protein
MITEIAMARATGGVSIPLDDKSAEGDIQWMPPGVHTITPFVNGEPVEMTIDVNSATAAHFGGQVQDLRSRARLNEGDYPFIDFNHEDSEAAAEVLELYWGGDDPVTGGIRAKVKWTGAGQEALAGKNYRRFSPQWILDKEAGKPIGIDVNVGGLVNKAAFKGIQPVVAKDGSAQRTPEELRALSIVEAALAPLRTQLDGMLAKARRDERGRAKARNGTQSNQAQSEHVAGGPAGPRKLLSHPFFLLVQSTAAQHRIPFGAALAMARELNPRLAADYVVASVKAPETAPAAGEHAFIVQARALAASAKIPHSDAQWRIAQANYPLYRDYASTLTASARKKRSTLASSQEAQQFIVEVNGLAKTGHTLADSASLVSAKNPGLYQAYRAAHVISKK